MIAILTVANDIHAIAVARNLEERHGEKPSIIEVDNVSLNETLHWGPGVSSSEALITLSDGMTISVSEFIVIWSRRWRSQQRLQGIAVDRAGRDLVDNDCRGTLYGMLETSCTGVWVSGLRETERASNKLVQLKAAQEQGFRIPRTIVSNNPAEVRSFVATCPDGAIAKAVVGTKERLAFVERIDPERIDDESVAICPAIFQEYVPGTKHVRLNAFGDDLYGYRIETENVDWRPDLNVPVSRWQVPEEVRKKIRSFLQRMGLNMGVFDLKESTNGELFWLEVNPQGQFLFLEGLTGDPLAAHFADFLHRTASTHRV
jgi:hypothetical protein